MEDPLAVGEAHSEVAHTGALVEGIVDVGTLVFARAAISDGD